jgi:hypothetical protein
MSPLAGFPATPHQQAPAQPLRIKVWPWPITLQKVSLAPPTGPDKNKEIAATPGASTAFVRQFFQMCAWDFETGDGGDHDHLHMHVGWILLVRLEKETR